MIYQVKIDEQLFTVEIVDLHTRPIQVLVDGECFEIWPEGQAQPVARMANRPILSSQPSAQPAASSKLASVAENNGDLDSIKAPIPGVVLTVSICPGETVQKGQELCTLEAMKMKNIIRSNREGVIATIHVTQGQTVAHGDKLMDYETQETGDR